MSRKQERFSGVKQVADWLRFDERRLEAWMQEHVEGFEGPLAVHQFKGGQSNPTYRLESSSGRYVMRRKPPGDLLPSAHAVDREYRVITALAETDVPVPRTHGLCRDEEVIGTWFFIMECVEGRVLWDNQLPGLDPDERSAHYDAMNDVLARLHRVDWKAVGLESYGKPGNYFARQIHRWTKQYRASETRAIEAMDRLIEWLPGHIPEDDETTLVHGDYRLDNLIFHPSEARIVAVLDWELSTLGHPMGDLSYHCMQWILPESRGGLVGTDLDVLGIPDLDSYRDAYRSRTRRKQIDHWDFYLSYNLFRSAAIAQGIAGRVRDGTAASEHAREIAASVPRTAELAWDFARRAGAA